MATSQSTSSRALLYFSERVEDATEAVKTILGNNGGAQKYIDTSDDHVRAQLESDRDEVRIEGLKTVITLISKGREASGYFASVVKLSSNANLEIRKLVYIIVRRYARRQPDVALLGINSFQRDLQDRNEVVRAMALRVLTGLRLQLATSVVELAIGKCVRDSSFYVRKAAALALIKSARYVHETMYMSYLFTHSPSYSVAVESRDAFVGHVKTLLHDNNPSVLGASLLAWSAICPDALEMLHEHFRKLCYALADMDEWSQREAIYVLGHYAKRCIPRPSNSSSDKLDRDLELLLVKSKDLLFSPNPAVVTAASRLIFSLAPESRHTVIARPLVRLVSKEKDTMYIALLNCLYLANVSPSLLEPHLYDFLPRSSLQEPTFCAIVKMQIMVRIAKADASDIIVDELIEQAHYHPDEEVAASAVDQLGFWTMKCEDRQRATSVRKLFELLRDRKAKNAVVARSLAVICDVIEFGQENEAKLIIPRLIPLLFTAPTSKDSKKKGKATVGKSSIHSSAARASIFWLVGQYCRSKININGTNRTMAEVVCLDVLRRAALHFAKEASDAKLQIVTLSTKLFTFLPTLQEVSSEHVKSLTLLHRYILQLARYDEDFDVRDRARFCKAMTERLEVGSVDKGKEEEGDDIEIQDDDEVDERLGGVVLRREQVLHILFEGKKERLEASAESKEVDKITSWNALDDIVGRTLSNSLPYRLPDFFTEPWAEPSEIPSPNVRESSKASTSSLPETSLTASRQLDNAASEDLLTTSTESMHSTSTPPNAPFQQAAGAKTKYTDLDAFLDAEESSERELNDDEELAEETYGGSLAPDESEEEEESESDEEEDEEEQSSSSSSELDSTEEDDGSLNAADRAAVLTAPPAEENAWA